MGYLVKAFILNVIMKETSQNSGNQNANILDDFISKYCNSRYY